MKMRWVVTFKGNGQLKARLVVEIFTNQRLGKIPTSSPTASRRSPQMFRTLAASLGFQTNKGAAKCAFLQSDMDEQHVNDNDDDDFNIEPTQPVSDTFCELDPALSRKLQKEHHTSVFACRKAVYVLVNPPRRRYHRVATDLRNKGGAEWTFEGEGEDGVIQTLCLAHVDDFMLARSGLSICKTYL